MPPDELEAFAEPRRRRILRHLRDGERSVSEIAAIMPDVSRPAVSQHLRVLRDTGLVVERREGTRRLYRLDPSGLAQLRKELEAFWTSELHDLADDAERGTHDDPPARS